MGDLDVDVRRSALETITASLEHGKQPHDIVYIERRFGNSVHIRAAISTPDVLRRVMAMLVDPYSSVRRSAIQTVVAFLAHGEL